MIRIQSEGGVARQIVPVFVCDVCGNAITNIDEGAAVFRDHGLGEGELHTVMHVHKRRCHDQAEAKLVGENGGPWHELRDHLNDVVAGMGVTIRGIIGREVVWTGTLTPSQNDELEKRITELGDWLRNHGIRSPLWD